MTTYSRRSWLRAGVMGPIGVALWRSGAVEAAIPQAQGGSRMDPKLASVKACVFDVFGTVVDWRSSVAADVQALARRKGVTVDAGNAYSPTQRSRAQSRRPKAVLAWRTEVTSPRNSK